LAEFILYSTLGCHLCEEAEKILSLKPGLSYTLVDIAESESLMERYGISIPVLRHFSSETELAWPFDSTIFLAWLENIKNHN